MPEFPAINGGFEFPSPPLPRLPPPLPSLPLSALSVTLELDKVAPFLIKLFEIVPSPVTADLVCWS